MVGNFQMPPAGFGPGSQAGTEDEALEYMPLPQDMRTYSAHLPEAEGEAPEDLAAVLGLLERFAAACRSVVAEGGARRFDLNGLTPGARRLLAETLGEGEVSVKMEGIPAIAAQESVFAGVWMLSGAGIDAVEVAAVPADIPARAFAAKRPGQGTAAPKSPGVVNAPPLLAELTDKSLAYEGGAAPHVVNLTLLPHTEEDLAWLDAALGMGGVTILSRGYGNCRVSATALPHVWRVQFFNSMDTLILDTFEVTGMPEVAIAAAEDLTDSAERIDEVRGAIA